MYLAFRLKQTPETVSKLECLAYDLKCFFVSNNLLSNDDKLIAMIVNGSRRSPCVFPPLSIGNVQVPASLAAKILGFKFDSNMTMSDQISSVTSACFLQLYRMYKIRQCLDEEAARSMVHSLITSRLDYCNALYYGLPDVQLNRLWCVQKASARLISNTKKYDHITPIMKRLHWIKYHRRPEFKVLVITYKSLNNMAPSYLSDLLVSRDNKGTRRDNQNLLFEPRFKRITYGGRSFSRAAPRLWNNLPLSVRLSPSLDIFKRNLKTHIFSQCYKS